MYQSHPWQAQLMFVEPLLESEQMKKKKKKLQNIKDGEGVANDSKRLT